MSRRFPSPSNLIRNRIALSQRTRRPPNYIPRSWSISPRRRIPVNPAIAPASLKPSSQFGTTMPLTLSKLLGDVGVYWYSVAFIVIIAISTFMEPDEADLMLAAGGLLLCVMKLAFSMYKWPNQYQQLVMMMVVIVALLCLTSLVGTVLYSRIQERYSAGLTALHYPRTRCLENEIPLRAQSDSDTMLTCVNFKGLITLNREYPGRPNAFDLAFITYYGLLVIWCIFLYYVLNLTIRDQISPVAAILMGFLVVSITVPSWANGIGKPIHAPDKFIYDAFYPMFPAIAAILIGSIILGGPLSVGGKLMKWYLLPLFFASIVLYWYEIGFGYLSTFHLRYLRQEDLSSVYFPIGPVNFLEERIFVHDVRHAANAIVILVLLTVTVFLYRHFRTNSHSKER